MNMNDAFAAYSTLDEAYEANYRLIAALPAEARAAATTILTTTINTAMKLLEAASPKSWRHLNLDEFLPQLKGGVLRAEFPEDANKALFIRDLPKLARITFILSRMAEISQDDLPLSMSIILGNHVGTCVNLLGYTPKEFTAICAESKNEL